jgi:hypothetical protein
VAALLVSLLLVLGLGGRALGGSARSGEERTRPQVLIVEPGATLWEIARDRVGSAGDPRPLIQEIREMNGLATSELQAGQKLLLPSA